MNIVKYIIIGVGLFMLAEFLPAGAYTISPRIINGKPAKLGQFPYYAYLDIKSFGFGKCVILNSKDCEMATF